MSDEILDNKNQEIHIRTLDGLYEDWFLDYASYVILERAVPALYDGLKPVQRRIFHAMKEMDDGRFNKVANIVGSTMQFHPHGDASIIDAIVNLGQKDLMIDCQGNWGDINTGDRAAAPRYIEARLSKFALEIGFNEHTTEWQLSYDGRKREPVNLPVKFPLLLAQGAEGIAVGLSTKILPHNFIELIEASIKILKKESFEIFPDFSTGGLVDVREYNEGKRGGRVRLRAKIEVTDKKTLKITEIPFSTTTTDLIDSILKANEKGKIKIKKVVDNTAKNVEIVIELQPNVSPNVTVDALYAFSDCEMSISPNCCVIVDENPLFTGVHDALKLNTKSTVQLLKRELEIQLQDLQDKWHYTSLEKIFFEEKIYKELENKHETWEVVLEAIEQRFKPYLKTLHREITKEDIVKLTEKPVRRIYKLDIQDLINQINKIEENIKQIEYDLANLTAFAINYFKNLLKKYGKGKERKTEIAIFDTVEVKQVAANNEKLFVNKKEGFIGYGKDMKKEEFVSECSDIDDVIVFTKEGMYKIVKIAEKTFIGKDIIQVAIWKKNDERTTYNAIYVDGKSGNNYAKRFNVTSITRDKEYYVTQGNPKSKLLYFSANANAEAEVLGIQLTQGCSARNKNLEFYFSELEIKGRSSQGNIATKYPIHKIVLKEKGESTLGGLDIWLDDTVGRLNTEKRGKLLGNFLNDDKILVIFNSGEYMLNNYELTNRYNMNEVAVIEKLNAETIISAIHYQPSKKCYLVKRFQIETISLDQKFLFITDENGAKLSFVTTQKNPLVEYVLDLGKNKTQIEQVNLEEQIDVKGWKAIGNKLIAGTVKSFNLIKQEVTEIETKKEIDFEITNLKDENEQGSLF